MVLVGQMSLYIRLEQESYSPAGMSQPQFHFTVEFWDPLFISVLPNYMFTDSISELQGPQSKASETLQRSAKHPRGLCRCRLWSSVSGAGLGLCVSDVFKKTSAGFLKE